MRTNILAACCVVLLLAISSFVQAVPVAPAAPTVGWLYDESYLVDGVNNFGAAVKDSFGTMNGQTAAGGSSNTTASASPPAGPSTSTDTPFNYSNNSSFSTVGGPGGSTTVWHVTYGTDAFRTRFANVPAVTVSTWLKYTAASLTANTDANSDARKKNANGFLALTIDGAGASGGSGMYLNLPFDTNPVDNTNHVLVGGSSIAADGFLSYVSTGVLIPEAWNHIVATLDFANDQIIVSINGGAFETSSVAFSADALTPGTSGGSPDIAPTRSFRSEYIGLMDELAIWPTALNSDNVEWLQLNSLHSLLPPSNNADYNGSGTVDAADYVLWRKDPSTHGGTPAGYDLWRAQFGSSVGSGSVGGGTVPEPTSCVALIVGGLIIIVRRGRRSQSSSNC